jgi:capsular polysaccharide biosynthesis protein
MNTPVKFDSLFLIEIIKKYFKHLVIIGVGAVVLSVIFTSEFFITPMYRSEAIVYPQNLIPYSTESPTEQMLQLLESNYIRDGLIEDFNLYDHYEIDKKQKYPKTLLFNMMKENIQIDKTKYESVEIVVMDKDPVIASQMVDSIVSKFHTKTKTLQREKTAEVVVILKKQLDYWKYQMDSMENVLRDIRMNYGILDFEEQMSSFSRVYYTAVADGKAGSGGNRPLDKVMSNMQEKGGEAVSLKEHLWRVRGTYNDIKVEYENVLKDMTKELTYSNLVTKPVPAERKSYPVRSLMILMFTASVLFFSLLVMVIMENNRRLRGTA